MRIWILETQSDEGPAADLRGLSPSLRALGVDARPSGEAPRRLTLPLLKRLGTLAPRTLLKPKGSTIIVTNGPVPGLHRLRAALPPILTGPFLVLQKHSPKGAPLPTGITPWMIATPHIPLPGRAPTPLPIPLKPTPPLAEASRETLRRRLRVPPGSLLIHCPLYGEPGLLRGAAGPLARYDRLRWLLPRGAAGLPGSTPLPRWLKPSTAYAIADALYIPDGGLAHIDTLLQGLNAPLPILLQGDKSSPCAALLSAAKAGLRLDLGSAPALRVGALSLAADPKLRDRLKRSGAAYIKGHLTPEAAARALIQLIESQLTLAATPSINGDQSP